MIITEINYTNLLQEIQQQENFPKQLKAFFFDMDGVLFDSMKNHEIAWRASFKEEGIDLPSEEAYLNEGSPAFETAKVVYKKFKNRIISKQEAETIKKRKHAVMQTLPPSVVMKQMPQLMELLWRNNIDRWVVTGSAQGLLIDRLELEYNKLLDRSKMVTALDVINGKPNPEPYLKAMEKSGYTRSEAIVIENAPLGIKAAKDAGLFTIGINTGPLDPKLLDDMGADMVLPNSVELYKLIDNWLPQLKK